MIFLKMEALYIRVFNRSPIYHLGWRSLSYLEAALGVVECYNSIPGLLLISITRLDLEKK
jgi:hypothetical protein